MGGRAGTEKFIRLLGMFNQQTFGNEPRKVFFFQSLKEKQYEEKKIGNWSNNPLPLLPLKFSIIKNFVAGKGGAATSKIWKTINVKNIIAIQTNFTYIS